MAGFVSVAVLQTACSSSTSTGGGSGGKTGKDGSGGSVSSGGNPGNGGATAGAGGVTASGGNTSLLGAGGVGPVGSGGTSNVGGRTSGSGGMTATGGQTVALGGSAGISGKTGGTAGTGTGGNTVAGTGGTTNAPDGGPGSAKTGGTSGSTTGTVLGGSNGGNPPDMETCVVPDSYDTGNKDCYVDSVGGVDTNDGLSADKPVKSQAKIDATCTVVRYKRGSIFKEKVKVTSKVKVYTNYGPATDHLPWFIIDKTVKGAGPVALAFGTQPIEHSRIETDAPRRLCRQLPQPAHNRICKFL